MPDTSSSSSAHLVNVDDLAPHQREIVDAALAMATPPGILIGAFFTADRWDVRLLLLEKGRPSLVRFSNPELYFDRSAYEALRQIHQFAVVADPLGTVRGEKNGQLWIRRPYAAEVLSPVSNDIERHGRDPLAILLTVLESTRALHIKGGCHGHLCPQNIGLDGSAVVLLDHGFYGFTTQVRSSPFAAPEIAKGAPPQRESDLFGIGALLRFFLGQQHSPTLDRLIERSASPDLRARPSLDEFEQYLFLRRSRASTAPTTGREEGGSSLGSGKLITPGAPAPAGPEGAPPASPPPRSEGPGPKHTIAITGERGSPPTPKEQPFMIRQSASRAPTGSSAPMPETAAPRAVPTKPAQRSTPPQSAAASTPPKTTSTASNVLWISLALGVALFVALRFFQPFRDSGGGPDLPFQEYWASNQPSLASQVVQSALAGNQRAQIEIVRSAFQDNQRSPFLLNRMIRTTFDPRWERELSPEDRRVIIAIAASQLHPEGTQDLPPLAELHPAVLLGIISTVPLEAPVAAIVNLPIDLLTKLPAPFGSAFLRLKQGGITMLDAKPVRALAHVISGDVDARIITAYLQEDPTVALSALIPVLPELGGIEGQLMNQLSGLGGAQGQAAAWFSEEPTAGWETVPAAQKLALILGEQLPKTLSLEQYADLLRFPVDAIRSEAAIHLGSKLLPQQDQITVVFLASDRSKLTRFETISLVAGLPLKGEEQYLFISKWFQNPNLDPDSILGLLLARNDIQGLNPINTAAARYLRTHESWEANFRQLQVLSRHPEPLARALAYSRLDPTRENERAALTAALVQEGDQRLRDQLSQKLSPLTESGIAEGEGDAERINASRGESPSDAQPTSKGSP